MTWALIWKIFLVLTLSLYSMLVIIVFFGGIKDVKAMFRDLKNGEESDS